LWILLRQDNLSGEVDWVLSRIEQAESEVG
jgi:hypothetical protein